MWCSKKRSKKWSVFFTCCCKITVQLVLHLEKEERYFSMLRVLQERYKGPRPRSSPVLVLAVDVLFKTSKAHQGWLSVFLQEGQAFCFSLSGEQSPFLLFGHLCRLHVNQFARFGVFYLCAWWMCTDKVKKSSPHNHSPFWSYPIPVWDWLHAWFSESTTVEVRRLTPNVLSFSRFSSYG